MLYLKITEEDNYVGFYKLYFLCWDPIVSPLLAGVVELIVVDGKDPFLWGMG